MFAIASVMTAITAASGQAPAPARRPAATPLHRRAGADGSPPKLDQKPPARARAISIVDADARNCLEFPSNPEIIKCAEKYLHRRAG
jgi:hypothetical protein